MRPARLVAARNCCRLSAVPGALGARGLRPACGQMSTKEQSYDKSAPSPAGLVREPMTKCGPGARICYCCCPCRLVFKEVIPTVGRLIMIILSLLFLFFFPISVTEEVVRLGQVLFWCCSVPISDSPSPLTPCTCPHQGNPMGCSDILFIPS